MKSLRVKSFRSPFFVLTFLIASVVPVVAQTPTGRLEGRVTDATGGVLPGATVTATNLGTSLTRTDVTDVHGGYSMPALPVGDYRIGVDLSGFAHQESRLTLSVSQVARLDFKLRLGAASETVTVTAAAPIIEKTTSQISTLIDSKQIENLPLNGRNFTQLATLAPGVTRGIPGSNSSGGGSGTDAETFRYSEFGGAALSVNGLREQFNNFLIEGVDNNETLVNSIAYLPPPDAIREFSVITTNAPAEFGRAGGGVQNLVIKSGTNDFHGSLYDFNRPKSLAATPAFAVTKPDFNNNDFGATFGGPIWRDRTFFFGSYHGLRNSIPIEAGNYVAVPTLKMRNGDFSELLNPAVSGLSQPVIIYDPNTGIAFPNNMIPSSLWNAAGHAYLNAFPNPTRAGVTHNYLTHRQKRGTYNDFDARFDHTLTPADQLFFSASDWGDKFADPGRIPGYQAGFGAGQSDNKGYSGRVGETHVFNSDIVNEFRGGYTNFHYDFLPVGFGQNQDAALGIGGPGGITLNNGISLIGGGDGTYIEYLGDFGQYLIKQRTMEVSDAVTWQHGVHSIKFGGNAIRRDLGRQRTQFGKGFYFFRDGFGFQPGYTGYEVSDMLIGKTNFTATGVPGFVNLDSISWENAIFAQDDWHLRPNLTLNLGLRWDVLTPYYERNNRIANYNPATQTLVLPNQNGATRSTRKTNWNDFGPRLGFNYLLNDRTAIRGGYGIFYTLDRGGIANQLTENPPYVVTEFRFDSTVPGTNVRLSDPIPLPTPVDPKNPVLPLGSGVVFVPANSKDTRVQQYSLGGQYELTSHTSAMLAYVGTRASNLATVLSSAGFGGSVASRLTVVEYIGTSKYDSIQATLRQMPFAGLSYLASYTFGNAKNDGPGFFPGNPSRGGSPTDPNCADPTKSCNLSPDYGNADYDVRNRFTLASTYELPFARGNALAGGWSINGVLTLQTGTPFTVYDQNGKRADLNGNPNNGPKNTSQWFNTSVFSTAKGAQGTEQRNAVRGPGYKSLDLSLFKNFGIRAGNEVQLRLEAFNIFNWKNYGQPNSNLGDPNFGKITGTLLNTERQVQLAARYVF
jgi:carboxypeptidase family protein/TonB-dependent receptor-like protein